MTTREISGKQLELDRDGHLTDASAWNEDIARELAGEEGIALTDRHWVVINYMRKEHAATGVVPTVRKITKNSGVETKEMYELFPKGPGKKAAKISGLPKPVGCV
ncbi:MAG: TusE/DsrC/DsvC family sulfur relay protein [Nitrospirota bacterium]|nr:TusE/DsrC/DsvC family sulfur relay protein [Nitrospirota bacterium]